MSMSFVKCSVWPWFLLDLQYSQRRLQLQAVAWLRRGRPCASPKARARQREGGPGRSLHHGSPHMHAAPLHLLCLPPVGCCCFLLPQLNRLGGRRRRILFDALWLVVAALRVRAGALVLATTSGTPSFRLRLALLRDELLPFFL